jgi:hypothetical protein
VLTTIDTTVIAILYNFFLNDMTREFLFLKIYNHNICYAFAQDISIAHNLTSVIDQSIDNIITI